MTKATELFFMLFSTISTPQILLDRFLKLCVAILTEGYFTINIRYNRLGKWRRVRKRNGQVRQNRYAIGKVF